MCAVWSRGDSATYIRTNCVFAQQLWYSLLAPVGLDHTVPRRSDNCFADWRSKPNVKVHKAQRKWFDSAVILGSTVLLLCQLPSCSLKRSCSIGVSLVPESSRCYFLVGGRVLVGLFLWLGHATVLVQVFNLYIFSCNHFLVPRGGNTVALCEVSSPLSLFNTLI